MAESARHGGDSPDEMPIDPDSDSIEQFTEARPVHLQLAALGLVFGGGVMGTLARYGIETAVPHNSPGWPVATFGINIAGAFVLGLLLENLVRRGNDTGNRRRLRLLAGTGFCGAFTTYSTFALETVLLARDGHVATALAYAVVTVVVGAGAAWAGIRFGARGSVR